MASSQANIKFPCNVFSIFPSWFRQVPKQNQIPVKVFVRQHGSEATSGTDIVKKCVQNLVAGTGLERVALVDAFGYDAFPALATLEAGK